MTIDWTKPIEDCRPWHEGEEATLLQTDLSQPGPFTRYVRFRNCDEDWLTEDGKMHSVSPSPCVRNSPSPPPVEHDFGFPYEIFGGDGGLTADRRERARKLRDDLYDAFPWDATEDNEDFWLDVSKRLERIAWKGR